MSTFPGPKATPSTESILPCYPQSKTHTHHIQIHRKNVYDASISAVIPVSNLSRFKFADLKIFQGRKVRLCFIYEQLRGCCRASPLARCRALLTDPNGEGFQHLTAKELGRGWGSRRKSEGWHRKLRKEDTDKGHEVRDGSEATWQKGSISVFTRRGTTQAPDKGTSIRSNASHTSLPKDTVAGISQDSDEEALCSVPAANILQAGCIWIIVLHLKDITIRMYTVWQPGNIKQGVSLLEMKPVHLFMWAFSTFCMKAPKLK